MANPGDFAYTVKQQADIVRIIGDYIKLKKAGAQNYSGLCPFHGEKTPSFSVHATRQFYHCFGCGVSGDVFSFVQKIENITFPESVRMVAQKLGIPLPKASYSTPGEAKEARLRGQLLDVHERAVAFFQECLRRPEGARAREYLAGRGLDQEMIARFRIGYAPDSGFLLRDRLKEEFSEEVLRESGLFSWKQDDRLPASGARQGTDRGGAPSLSVRPLDGQGGDVDSAASRKPEAESRKPLSAMYSKFRNRVMFPIASEAGKVIAFTGRTLATDEKSGPKYLNSPETPIYSKGKVLFNLDLAKEWIKKFDYAILVEGQMDCISVYAAGFHNVIASSGTAFTELQAKLLGRFSKNVVVNFDPDTAGAKATERTLGLLVEEEFKIKVLTLEQGFDPDLYIRRKGKEAYGDALKHSQKYFDYLIERARTQFPVRSGEGKAEGRELSAAPHPARPQPHRPRRTGARDLAEAGHRFRRAAAGTAPRRRHPRVRGQSPSRSASHRRRKSSDSRPGLGPPNANPPKSISPRATAPKKNSIPPARRSSSCRTKVCIAASRPSRWPSPCSTSAAEAADVLEVPATRERSPHAGPDSAQGGRRTHRRSSRSRGPRPAPHSLAPPSGGSPAGTQEARPRRRQRAPARTAHRTGTNQPRPARSEPGRGRPENRWENKKSA